MTFSYITNRQFTPYITQITFRSPAGIALSEAWIFRVCHSVLRWPLSRRKEARRKY